MPDNRKNSRIASLCAGMRELGVGNFLLYATDRMAQKLGLPLHIVRYVFVAQPVAASPMLPERRGRAIMVRQAGPGDDAFASLPLTAEVVAFRFAQQPVCFVAEQEGRTIGCLWLCFERFVEDEVRCVYRLEPPENTAWDFDVYVTPEARAGFGFLKLWDAANAYLSARGIAWSVSRISAFNSGSLQVHSKLGTRRLGTATFFRIGAAQLYLSRLAPYVYFSARSGRSPCITLQSDKGHSP